MRELRKYPFVQPIERLVSMGLDRVVENQLPIITLSYGDTDVLRALKREAITNRVNWASSRHGVEDGWVRVNRARFFPETDNRTAGTAVASRVLRSKIFVPQMHQFAKHVTSGVHRGGDWSGIPEWRVWHPNRLGINIMDGEPGLPARIAPHVDTPKESGVVVVLELGNGEDPYNVSTENNLTLIPGLDVCRRLGMQQAVHGGQDVFDTRYSLTFADLRM